MLGIAIVRIKSPHHHERIYRMKIHYFIYKPIEASPRSWLDSCGFILAGDTHT